MQFVGVRLCALEAGESNTDSKVETSELWRTLRKTIFSAVVHGSEWRHADTEDAFYSGKDHISACAGSGDAKVLEGRDSDVSFQGHRSVVGGGEHVAGNRELMTPSRNPMGGNAQHAAMVDDENAHDVDTPISGWGSDVSTGEYFSLLGYSPLQRGNAVGQDAERCLECECKEDSGYCAFGCDCWCHSIVNPSRQGRGYDVYL